MRDTWYGDKRDLVKWGALVHLAHRERVSEIIQVAFLRKGNRPLLQTVHGEVAIAEEVWAHFRNVRSIESLSQNPELRIEVITRPFDFETRQDYISWVGSYLHDHGQNKVVLLDPDTGIEPQRASREHVKVTEVRDLWEALIVGDWLVLYQHKWLFDNRWREITREKFQLACGTNEIEIFSSESIADDVVFFAAKKT